MIDLSTAVVGDKFKLRCGDTAELIGVNDKKTEFMLKDNDGFHINDISGISLLAECGGCNIISKHDPRHWLKDLPDADLFTGEWIAVENNGENSDWYSFAKEPLLGHGYHHTNGMFVMTLISGIKMPTITGDGWKKSKISIAELREWQKLNKEQAK